MDRYQGLKEVGRSLTTLAELVGLVRFFSFGIKPPKNLSHLNQLSRVNDYKPIQRGRTEAHQVLTLAMMLDSL